jgi:hypothetical protein
LPLFIISINRFCSPHPDLCFFVWRDPSDVRRPPRVPDCRAAQDTLAATWVRSLPSRFEKLYHLITNCFLSAGFIPARLNACAAVCEFPWYDLTGLFGKVRYIRFDFDEGKQRRLLFLPRKVVKVFDVTWDHVEVFLLRVALAAAREAVCPTLKIPFKCLERFQSLLENPFFIFYKN